MSFESIYMSGPELAKRSQPGIHLLKWFRFQPVETALCINRSLYEPRLSQHTQVLRHGRLGHPELTLDLSYGLFRRDQKTQYGAAVRLGDDFEYRFHAASMSRRVYTCQGI